MRKNRSIKYILLNLFIVICVTASLAGCQGSLAADTAADTFTNSTTELLAVHFIDVGQAKSIVVQSPDGYNMLIDAGETKNGAVEEYIKRLNIKKFDAVIATHPHSDHISEMADVINDYTIGSFYMPKVMHTSKQSENMTDALSAKGIKPIEAKAGVNFQLGEYVDCMMAAPCSSGYKDLNDWSAVTKLTYGSISFLFTGDAEMLSENEILENGADISADVLDVGHHGSSSSTGEAFLQAVNPSYAVISCGKDNDYGHPHKETLEALADIETFITARDGSVTFYSDGSTVYTQTESADNTNAEKNSGNAAEIQYIGNKSSEKFHKSDCSNLPAPKNQVILNSREEAVSSGYTPCGSCNP